MQIFSKQEITEDFDFMIKTMEEVHPNLYAYVNESDWKKEARLIRDSFTDGMSGKDYLRKTGKLVASLKDGHTSLYYHYDNQDYTFIVNTRFKDWRLFVVYDINDILKSQDEILSINGKPVSEITREIHKYLAGETDAFKNFLLQSYLGCLLKLIYDYKDSMTIKVRRDNSDVQLQYQCLSVNEYMTKIQAITTCNTEKSSSGDFEIENEIGSLRIDTFSYYKGQQESFKAHIDNVFKELNEKRIKNLIIDVRCNYGGNSLMSEYLAAHLTDKPIYSFDKEIWKSSQQIRDFVLDDIKNNTHGYYKDISIYERLTSVGVGENCICDGKKSEYEIDKANIFRGNIFVLSNSGCFSSTTDFLSIIRDFSIGKIVGTTSGGLPNSYGDVYMYSLPHTKLYAGVSQKFFVRSSGNENDNDLTPEYVVEPTLQDIANGFDAAMEFTKNLIKNNSE